MPKMIDEFDIQLYLFLLADTADLGTIWGVQARGWDFGVVAMQFVLPDVDNQITFCKHFISHEAPEPSRIE